MELLIFLNSMILIISTFINIWFLILFLNPKSNINTVDFIIINKPEDKDENRRQSKSKINEKSKR